MDRYQLTYETWNKVAALYQEKFMDLHDYHDTYDRFCQLIEKENPTVFEMGCGPGNITKYLLSKRPDFRIQATDFAPNMIELAKANNPTAECMIMDCREIGTLATKYDAIMAGFCMPYLSKDDVSKLLKDCSGLLQQGGILYFSTIKGDHRDSSYVTASTGDKCFIYYYEEAFLQQELQLNNFVLLDLNYKHIPKSDGTTSVEMIFISKKT